MQDVVTFVQTLVVNNGLNLIWAVVIFFVGRWAAGIASNLLKNILKRANTTQTLVNFLASLTYYGILTFAVIAAFERVGVATTSFVAIIGAAGLAVGLALQGSLSNFASGVLILILRPFTVGDYIEAADASGHVEDIQVFNTILNTLDNKTVIIPNSQITAGNIVNYSRKGQIRIDLVYGIGYGDDLLKAKQVFLEIAQNTPSVLKEPAPMVAVSELGDSSVNFIVRVFVKPEDYWGVGLDMTEQVKLRLDAENISIPFPQRDVHLYSVNGSN